MLHFKDVHVVFPGGTRAVDGVSLTVPRGQFCVVLGSSGAGKSTLLRTVNGLVRPTSGSVDVDGVSVLPRNLKAIRGRVGMIHQQFNLVGRASVHRNVMSGALHRVGVVPALAGLFPRGYRHKACDLLAEVGLDEEHLYRRAGNLSGGQQQRVAIARAFMLDPTVVLADEPVASLDPGTSMTVLSLLRESARRHNATVMCSLHQLAFAREFADRIVGMALGRVIYDGPPNGLSDRVLRRIYGDMDTGLMESDRLRPIEDQDELVVGAGA